MTLTPPPFDPELAAVLAASGHTSIATGITPETIAAQRELLLDGVASVAELSRDGVFTIAEHTAPGPAGAPDISLLVARPRTAVGPRPVLYHTHGGGLIMGNNRFGLEPVLDLAEQLNLVVVSVAYRLAPEHPFPAGLEDAYAGLLWTARKAASISADPERIVLVMCIRDSC